MNIVITGGTRGIGRGMAEEFVRRGHNVTISGRDAAAVEQAAAEIGALGSGECTGAAGEISRSATHEALWSLAVERFGPVDIWVNNAGMTNRKLKLDEVPPGEVEAVISANLTGLINGCRVAIAGMLEQGKGKIFNMEGFGSDGMTQQGMTTYGATKRGVRYVTDSLAKEYEDSPLIIANLSPGIVVTEFVTRDLYAHDPDELNKRKKFLSLLADRVETVAPALVDGMLALDKNGGAVRWMTPTQALGRILMSPFRKRDPFAEPVGADSH
jgi:NAD(P)-dependent dehydrogenase (short-subunit alcohol dehydrogenase family)